MTTTIDPAVRALQWKAELTNAKDKEEFGTKFTEFVNILLNEDDVIISLRTMKTFIVDLDTPQIIPLAAWKKFSDKYRTGNYIA